MSADEDPKRWLDKHRKTAVAIGWVCVTLGIASIVLAFVMATGTVDLGTTCVTARTTTSEPSASSGKLTVEETEETRTCTSAGLVGPAVIPLALGVLLAFPAIRLLLADSEIGGPFFSYKGSPTTSKAEEIKAAEASDQAEWNTSVLTRLDEVAVLVEDTQLRLKTLSEIVEPRRKRFRRS